MSAIQSLKPSTELIGDGAAMRTRFAEDGYLYFPGLLSPDKVAALGRDILQTIAQFGWIADGTDPIDALPSQPPRFPWMEHTALRDQLADEGRDLKDLDQGSVAELLRDTYQRYEDKGWRAGYIAIQRLESFHRQAHAPEVLGLLRTLFAENDILVHGKRIARVVWPSSSDAPPTTPHQDFTNIQGTADVVTTWVPLTDCPRERGGLRILVGSHRSGIRAVSPAKGAVGICCKDVSDTDPNWATADWHMGDVVIFHSLTVHASQPNFSGKLRLSVDYRYQSAKEPVTVDSLRPHSVNLHNFYPYVPDWPELLKSVSWSSYEWVDRARSQNGLQIAENIITSGELDTWHEDLAATTRPSRLLQPVE